ncbi:MAG: ATP-binding protein [Gammaproteobacteria bacterium]|nr:ATP-binding protein [Gammaproteobacteria bacterium]
MRVTHDFRQAVVGKLIERREIFVGTDKRFATTWVIPQAVWSTLKKRHADGSTDYNGLLKDPKWIGLGRSLGVLTRTRKWNTVRTDVFETIEEDIKFCKQYSKARIFVDDCAIGKTYTAKYLAAQLPNTFYVDCSQCKTHPQFVRQLALAIGVDHKGPLLDVSDTIRYWLTSLERPIVILDEAGDLNVAAFLELKSLWNATENACGWYMMGADGLRAKIDRGYNNKRLGYAEIFSRFSEKYSTVVPVGKEAKKDFYQRIITQVLRANMDDSQLKHLGEIVTKCVTHDSVGRFGGLRRAESLLILHSTND